VEQTFSWIVTILGLIGFWLAGKKLWWSWYINIANQIAWVIFAVITDYYAFLVGTVFYFVVFSRNAYLWTKDHFNSQGDIPEPPADEPELPYLTPYCGNVSNRLHYACVKPGGHDGEHGYAGTFWTDEEGTWVLRGRVVANPPQYCEYTLVEKPDGSGYGTCLIDHIHIGTKQE
jgi:hypothetical protein